MLGVEVRIAPAERNAWDQHHAWAVAHGIADGGDAALEKAIRYPHLSEPQSRLLYATGACLPRKFAARLQHGQARRRNLWHVATYGTVLPAQQRSPVLEDSVKEAEIGTQP